MKRKEGNCEHVVWFIGEQKQCWSIGCDVIDYLCQTCECSLTGKLVVFCVENVTFFTYKTDFCVKSLQNYNIWPYTVIYLSENPNFWMLKCPELIQYLFVRCVKSVFKTHLLCEKRNQILCKIKTIWPKTVDLNSNDPKLVFCAHNRYKSDISPYKNSVLWKTGRKR